MQMFAYNILECVCVCSFPPINAHAFAESSKLFYSGRTTFEGATATAALRERFGSVSLPDDGDAAQVVLACRKPFELTDFGAVLLDSVGNAGGGEHIVDVAAGDEHFVALTGQSKWFSHARFDV